MTRQWEIPGTQISNEDIKSGRVMTVVETIHHRYRRDLGIAQGRFLKELKNGRIVGTKCRKCQRVVVPPRIFCEVCFRNMDEWVELPDTGFIGAFTNSYIDKDGVFMDKPLSIGLIGIDGTSRDIYLPSFIGEIKPEEVRIGMRVKALWRAPDQRKGAVTDIEYFRPY